MSDMEIYDQLRNSVDDNPLESNCMDDLQVEIVRFVEECQPNMFEARFSDSEGLESSPAECCYVLRNGDAINDLRLISDARVQ